MTCRLFIPCMCPVRNVVLAAGVVVLAACGSLAGVGGRAEYACQAPEGVQCDSVSGTYANALQHKLPGQRPVRPASRELPAGETPPARSGPGTGATRPLARGSFAPTALRSEARVLRLWIKPWEDSDGALHDQGYVYLQADRGRWLIEHAQRRIRDAYAPLRPPPSTALPAEPRVPIAGAPAHAAGGSQSLPGRPPSAAPGDEQ